MSGKWTRRGVVSAAAAAYSGLAGCGNDRAGTPERDEDSGESETATQGTNRLSTIESRLSEVYTRLAELPIADDGNFVFDVAAFEEEFDHRAISDRADEIIADVSELDDDGEISPNRAETLTALARLADDRATQRYLLHQTIAATFAYDERVRDTRYEAAVEPIAFAGEKLGQLSVVGERVATIQQRLDGTDVSIDGYSREAVQREQSMLLDVAAWLSPASEALHEMARGYAVLDEGNRSLRNEEPETAVEHYRAANVRFESANESFEKARGRGKRIGYVLPIVEESRCALSGLLEGTDMLADAIEVIQAGDQQRGESLGREAIERMEQQRNRCR